MPTTFPPRPPRASPRLRRKTVALFTVVGSIGPVKGIASRGRRLKPSSVLSTAMSAQSLGRAAGWFPVVGLGLGLVLVGVERVTSVLFPSLLAALLTVTAWKVLTGGLHLDGLADCLDGLVGRDAEHRLSIMRDSRIGAFGAIGLILFLLLEIAAVAELPAGLRWL